MGRSKRRPLAVLLAILVAVVMGLSLVPGRAAAATLEVGPGKEFATIQDAVNAASPGDTVLVDAGTYNENVLVNKTLTITGSGAGATIVRSPDDTKDVFTVTSDGVSISGLTVMGAKKAAYGSRLKAGVFINGANNCTISAVTATDNNVGIYLKNSSGTTVAESRASGNYMFGIYLESSSGNTVVDNNAAENGPGGGLDTQSPGQIGIYLKSSHDNTIKDNEASLNSTGSTGFQKGNGIYLWASSRNTLIGNTANQNTHPSPGYNSGAGICLSGANGESGNRVLVQGNTAKNNSGSGIVLYQTHYADVTDNTLQGNRWGYYTEGAIGNFIQHNDVSGNTVSGNEYGLYLWNDRSTYSDNSITGNTAYGVYAKATGGMSLTGTILRHNDISGNVFGAHFESWSENDSLDARENWWSDATGPKHTANPLGTGDEVSDGVEYAPWYVDADRTKLVPVYNETQDKYYLTIQAAIDAASSGDTIQVGAGTYAVSQIRIGKPLTLRGAGAGTTIIDGGKTAGTRGTINIGPWWVTGTVIIDGFTIQNFGYTGTSHIGLVNDYSRAAVTVQNCHFIGNDNTTQFAIGIWVIQQTEPQMTTIQDCEFEGMWNGIMLESPVGGARVLRNEFHDLHHYAGIIEPRGVYALTYEVGGTVFDVVQPMIITGNSFYQYSGAGVTMLGYNPGSGYGFAKFTNVEIQDNIIDCTGTTAAVRNVGIRLYNGGMTAEEAVRGGVHNVTISGNTITGAGEPPIGKGIWVMGPNNNITIRQNTISGLSEGIVIDERSTGVGLFAIDAVAFSNNISGNVKGVNNKSAAPTNLVDARFNYWGDGTGPSGEGPGEGDAVSENVLFDPWYVDPARTVLSNDVSLTVYVVGSGTVTRSPDQAQYAHGTQVQLTAVPAAGWTFSHWEGGLTGSDNPGTITMDGNKTVTAVFAEVYVPLPPVPPPPAPPVVPGPVSQTIGPDAPATVKAADGKLTITVPLTAVTVPATITVGLLAEGDEPPPGAGLFKVGDHMYYILVEDNQGNPVQDFAVPLTLTWTYDPAALPEGIQEEDLQVFYWDTALKAWIVVPSEQVDGTVVASVDHLTVFALMAAPDLPVPTDLAGHWAEDHVLKLVSLGAVTGFEDRTFRPEVTVTRAQFTVMLVRALGFKPVESPRLSFTDTVPDWAAGYVAAALHRGLVAGFEDGSFRPDEPITREQLAAMVVRAARHLHSGVAALRFTDASEISDWALSSVQAAVNLGIVMGFDDGTFRPKATATRGQAATMMSRLVDRLAR